MTVILVSPSSKVSRAGAVETAEFIINNAKAYRRAESTPSWAGIEVVDLARLDFTDYVNPGMPEERLAVE